MSNKVRDLRKQKGITQKRLSEISNVPRICIARYEAGNNIGFANAIKLAAALGVSIEELIGKAG